MASGGKREGSGRKKIGDNVVSYTIKLPQKLKDIIKERGGAEYIRKLVEKDED